jgi:tetratricopeptide (TPR) repeat protein
LSVLGRLKFQQEKYDEALDVLSRAARLDPRSPEIENYLGVILGHKGLRAQAETALRKAVQLDPNYGPAHNNLAVIYLGQQPPRLELARWHYQKALGLGQPHNPDLERILEERSAPVVSQ